jgi:hypothetical protein
MKANQLKLFEILHDSIDEVINNRNVNDTDTSFFTEHFKSILNKNLKVIENKEEVKRLNELLFGGILDGKFFMEMQNNIFDIQYILKFATDDFK